MPLILKCQVFIFTQFKNLSNFHSDFLFESLVIEKRVLFSQMFEIFQISLSYWSLIQFHLATNMTCTV